METKQQLSEEVPDTRPERPDRGDVITVKVDGLAHGDSPDPVAGNHSHLEGQELVEAEPLQGGVAGRECLRVVGALQGGGDRGQNGRRLTGRRSVGRGSQRPCRLRR